MGLKETGLRGSFRNVSVGITAIPDSTVHQYLVNDFTTSNWPDSVGPSDIDTIVGLTGDSTAFDDTGGVVGDGTDDFGQSDPMGSWGSEMETNFAISVPFETTDDGSVMMGLTEGTNGPGIQVVMGDLFDSYETGVVGIRLQDSSGNNTRVYTTSSFNDGNPHHAIINKRGSSASEVDIYVDDMSTVQDDASSVDDATDDYTDFTLDMTYFARNNEGDIDNHYDGVLGDVRWFTESLDESERQSVNDDLSWT